MGAGGAARTLLNIINNLDRSKFKPLLVTLDYNGNYEEHLKSDVKFIKLKTKRLRNAILPLARVIKKERVYLVFSTIPNYNTIALLANLLSFSDAKSIVREADNLGGTITSNAKLIAYGFIYKFADQVISLSEGVKANLVKRYKVKPQNIKVIYNPVDLENIKENLESQVVKKEHSHIFQIGDKVIVTAGRLVKQKDQKTLIQAFEKVNRKIKSQLVILGEGELEEELKGLVNELGLKDRVHFVGFQYNPYIYMKEADLFVLSSIHEGFGHVLVEALATGTPVISTNCRSGPKEVLEDGEYGILTEVGNVPQLANRMIQVLSLDKEELEQLIKKGYKRAEDFDATKIVKQYEKIFMENIRHE